MSQQRSIEELLREAREGERRACDELDARCRDELARFVRSRLGPKVKAQLEPEDIVQETFLRAFDGLNRFEWRGEGSFEKWLRGIAEHLIRNATRKRSLPLAKLVLEIAGDDVSPSRAMRREERFARFEKAVESLRPEHREVIRLARLEGLPTSEIAARLERSPGAVRALLCRALEQLKQRFGETASLGLPERTWRPSTPDEEGRDA